MIGYMFVYGVDFDAAIAPACKEGVYLNKKNAWNRFVELTEECLKNHPRDFYEDGWGEDEYPKKYRKLFAYLEDNNEWDEIDRIIEEHKTTDINEICSRIMEMDEPPYYYYQMVEIEIR